MNTLPRQLLRKNLVPLIHSVGSLIIFVWLSWYFIYHEPDPDYNDLLSVLIGALVTIVTIMFSAVLVALQLASAQFSPRITRSFFRENRFLQAAFYLFLFGIAYCLAVKFTYSMGKGRFEYPELPVLGAIFGFFLISFVLPRFVFYIADSINVATIARGIARRTVREIDELYGTERWRPGDLLCYNRPEPERPSQEVALDESGFLDLVRYDRLDALALQYPGWAFYVEQLVGNFITAGETVVKAQSPAGEATGTLPVQMYHALQRCFVLSKYRSYEQDVLFGVRQLVDVAIKAISPAVNDPTTCVNCLHYLSVITRHFSAAKVPSLFSRGAHPGVLIREFTFEILVNHAFDQIYHWGKRDSVVVCQILNALTDVARNTDNPHNIKVLIEQVKAFELDKREFELVEHQERVRRYKLRFFEVAAKNS